MINGKKVTLRLFRENDLEEFTKLTENVASKGEFYPLQIDSFEMIKKEFGEKGWADKDDGGMLICDEKGKMVGDIWFFKSSVNIMTGYEIGYQIFNKNDYGKGYMSEALSLFSAYLFSIKPIERLGLFIVSENKVSIQVAKNCGYKHEGTLRRTVREHLKFFDFESYSLLKEEIPSLRELLQKIN